MRSSGQTALRSAFEAAIANVTTPAYVYDLAEVRRNQGQLREALPAQTAVYYSLKANPHPQILRELLVGGARAEVCSPGELSAALDAGWPAGTVLYTGPGKRDADLAEAITLGVRYFSVDSAYALAQLERISAAAEVRVRCLLRINSSQPAAGQGLAMTGVASQFGVDTEEVTGAPERFAGSEHVEIHGLHLYMGSNVGSVDELVAQYRNALDTARELGDALAPYDVRLQVLDLGGGFGAPFGQGGQPADLDGLRERLGGLFDELAPGWRERAPEIVFESGRYLTATAGTLVVSVLDAKRSHGKDVVVLDSGINHLGGMAGLRRLPPLNPRLEGPGLIGPTRPTIVAGPLCTPLDTWSRAAPLPPMRPGDRLSVPNVGAYGLYASLLAFLGHPVPDEVVVDSGRPTAPPHVSQLQIARLTERS